MKRLLILLGMIGILTRCSVQPEWVNRCDELGGCDDVGTVAGIFYFKNGGLAKNATVAMRPRDYLPRIQSLSKRRSTQTDNIYITTTDNYGQFSFDSVPEGVYCIEAISSDDKLRLFIDGIVVDQEFLESGTWIQIDTPWYDTRLKPSCTIKGVITPADDTVSGTVQVFGLDVYATINSDGSFILDNLPQGTLRLKITTKQNGNVHDDTLIVSTTADGSKGDPGEDSLNTLVRIVPEPAGSNCEAGGRRVETGLDINNNDTLDNTEVTDISYICNKVLHGNYTVNSQKDLDEMVYTEITGNVTINAPDINNIDGFSSLVSIGGYLSIYGNASLTNLDGLSSLIYVGGNLRINDNTVLRNLDGLSNITYGGGIIFSVGSAGPQGLGGSYLVHDSSLVIENNTALTNIDGLSGITHVGGDLRICSNAALINIDGLSKLSSVNGSLKIDSNTSLTNIDGLSGITSIDKHLSIVNNTALINIDGLSNTTLVDGYLSIEFNTALTNLDGLSGITYMGGDLDILSNQALASITGLSNLFTLGGNYTVQNNVILPTCQAQIIADNLINNHDYTGTITISGNDDTGTCP